MIDHRARQIIYQKRITEDLLKKVVGSGQPKTDNSMQAVEESADNQTIVAALSIQVLQDIQETMNEILEEIKKFNKTTVQND